MIKETKISLLFLALIAFLFSTTLGFASTKSLVLDNGKTVIVKSDSKKDKDDDDDDDDDDDKHGKLKYFNDKDKDDDDDDDDDDKGK